MMNVEHGAAGSRPTLVRRVFSAGTWTMLGFGLSQAMRLGVNLVLTRLLFPEAFGLMAIVQTVITGIVMLSDLGIDQSIIYHSKGDSSAFLNTAWTVNIVRNVILWIILCILAAPIAKFYGEPLIFRVLPVAGLVGIISSLGSTKMIIASCSLMISKNTLIDVGSSVLGLGSTVLLAWLYQSIWALVLGNLIGTGLRTIGSHLLFAGPSNKFEWHTESIRAMATFGRWIFVGTALTFFVGEGNRLLIGGLLPIDMLAFVNLATNIVQLPFQISQQISRNVSFPAYSEIARDRPERLYSALARMRLVILIPHWLISTLFVYFGPALMNFLYDYRYKDAGWILQLLALGWLSGCVSSSYSGVLLAKGWAHLNTILLTVQLLIQVTCLLVGYYEGGNRGLVIGLSAAFWLLYPANAYLYYRLSLWQPKIDIPFLGLSILIVISMLGRLAPQ